MTLNIVHYEQDGRARWGVVRDKLICPIPDDFATTGDFLRGTNTTTLRAVSGPTIPLESVRLRSPVTRNQQFVCQGANYRQHMIESGMNPDAKNHNMIFTKATSCIVPADGDVVIPRGVRFLDYEIELGLVLRRDITERTHVRDEDLLEFIAALVIVNDYSARDVQIPELQFYKGKSFRTFGPVGPYLCLLEPDDRAIFSQLSLVLTVNGEVRQRDTTSNMVYGPAATLTELSGVHDLLVGDLLSTGTPAGCALRIPPPLVQRFGALLPEQAKWAAFLSAQERQRKRYLKPGDIVEARIATSDGKVSLGAQRNRIVAEGAL